MKSLKVLILLGIAIISFEAFGQSRAVLTVLKGGAGRALLNRTIESSPSAKAFFAGVLGLKTRQLDLIDPAIRQALITNRLNVEGPDQVRLIERARGFITAVPTNAVDLSLTSPQIAMPESDTTFFVPKDAPASLPMIPFGVHKIPDPTERDFFIEGWTIEFEQSGWKRVRQDLAYVDYAQYIGKTVGGILNRGKGEMVSVYQGTLLNVRRGSAHNEEFTMVGIVRNWDGHIVEAPLAFDENIFFVHKEAPAAPQGSETLNSGG